MIFTSSRLLSMRSSFSASSISCARSSFSVPLRANTRAPITTNHHVFCKHCGVRLYTYGHVAEIGGDYVSIMLSTFDDLPAAELAAAPVQYMNGRDDDWFHDPAETRHL